MKKTLITPLTSEPSINPRGVVEQIFTVFNAGDLNRVVNLVAKDIIYHLLPGGHAERKRGVYAISIRYSASLSR